MIRVEHRARTEPALAVVMPSLNQARYIVAAVQSVLNQGVEGLRLLIQDGGSEDGTLESLAPIIGPHGLVDLRSEHDDGPARALDRALHRALDTGAPVIGWLNSDDLYTPGALQRALAHLAAHPDQVAVYGEGEHIDADGRPIGRYPTLAPEVDLGAWRDGCPVCQPTMFLRREALQTLLPVDVSLRTAFDYELWLRLFKAFPGRIGFIPEVQAQSRLHTDGITARQREQVALEGLQVVHRHLGPAPGHWLLTHSAEALAACPFEAEASAVKQHLLALADHAAPWLEPGGAERLKQQMQASPAWRLSSASLGVELHADGWAGPQLQIRLRQPPVEQPAVGLLRVHGRHAWPRPGRLRLGLSAWQDGQRLASGHAWWRCRFVLDIPVHDRQAGSKQRLQVRANAHFVPAEVLVGSRDMRQLAWQVERIEILPAAQR